jgi:hypothetical protein
MRPIYHPRAAVAIRAESGKPVKQPRAETRAESPQLAIKPVTGGIAARSADIADATVIASINVTDQSMGRGPPFRDREYSRRSWVRFAHERLDTRVIDALK